MNRRNTIDVAAIFNRKFSTFEANGNGGSSSKDKLDKIQEEEFFKQHADQ
jgi:hypothetical protein